MARKNVTFPDDLYEKAEILMNERSYPDFSGYLQQLVRDDWKNTRGDQSHVRGSIETSTGKGAGFTKEAPEPIPVDPAKLRKVPQHKLDEIAKREREDEEIRTRRGVPKRK